MEWYKLAKLYGRMTPRATKEFRDCLAALPEDIRRAAKQDFDLWKLDNFHGPLEFKQIQDELWSVRIGPHFRALGLRYLGTDGEDTVTWYIGSVFTAITISLFVSTSVQKNALDNV